MRTVDLSREQTRVTICDDFVPGDVVAIQDAIAGATPAAEIQLDLRAARGCQAHALLLFVQLVANRGGRASYLGLTEPHRRLLHYLGHDVPPAAVRDEA